MHSPGKCTYARMKKYITYLLLCLAITVSAILPSCAPKGQPTDTTDHGTSHTEPSSDPQGETDRREPSTSGGQDETQRPESDTIREEETAPEEPLSEGNLRIMSINLDANEATIAKRQGNLIALLKSYDPDSIGVQECRGGWHARLKRGLDGYTKVGVAADGLKESATSFGTYIFYKTEKFHLIASGTFWLSETPDVPSIYSSTVDCNRTCTWAILQDKETGYTYVHMNAHLDWMDVQATNYQMALIREQILRFEAMGLPVFATGDYNTDEGSDTYKIMLANQNIADSKYVAEKTMSLGTYPDYGKLDVEKDPPIDFCFVTKDMVKVSEYKVVAEKPHDEYISDHYPLFIHATIQKPDDRFTHVAKPDISSLTISRENIQATALTVTFNNVSGDQPILSYHVKVADATGKVLKEIDVMSGYMNKNVPDKLSAIISKLEPDTEYTVTITAKNLLGLISDEVSAKVKTDTASVTPVEVQKADLFDLGLDHDGNFVDLSSSGLEITVQGNVAKGNEDTGYIAGFSRDGALKIPGIADMYDVLNHGFTSEVYVKIRSTSVLQNFFANMHAGGFGYEIENGYLFTYLHCGGSYRVLKYQVTEGETYHLVTVYDTQSLKLYVNGELVSSMNVSGDIGLPTAPTARYLCIGADSDESGNSENFADADIYIARLYSSALSDGQALYLYEQAKR